LPITAPIRPSCTEAELPTVASRSRIWLIFEPVTLLLCAAFMYGIFRRALPLGDLDAGLAYQAGQVAWKTGRPELLFTWIGTPFLAATTAVATKVASSAEFSTGLTIVNLALWAGAIALAWIPLYRVMRSGFWWASLVAAAFFAPVASTLMWKQFNLISFVLVVAGFAWASKRPYVGGFATALSIAIKPIAILVPLALLWKRETRKAGITSLAVGAVLLGGSQAFLAWRAHSLRALDPLDALSNFGTKSQPHVVGWVCSPENYSPQSMFCRLGGADAWDVTRYTALAGAVILIAVGVWLLRRRTGRSWLVFAFACACSPLVSPLAWSHYQILLAPLLLVLLLDFQDFGAGPLSWLGLMIGFALTELTWRPYGTFPDVVGRLISHNPEILPGAQSVAVFGFAELAQYVLLATFLIRLGMRASAPEQAAGPDPGLVSQVPNHGPERLQAVDQTLA
jgi:glycosyl transferase family 87